MPERRVDITIVFKCDGRIAAPPASYTYDDSNPEDIINTATTVANAVMKMKNIQQQFSAGLEVKLNMTQEFQPYLMKAIEIIRQPSWNVQTK